MKGTNPMPERVAVIDASLVLKALLPNPETRICQAVLADLQDVILAAPALWLYEITSAAAKAVYFNQLTPLEAQTVVRQALGLDVQLIPPDKTQAGLALEWTLRLKRGAAYDSFYLAIAEALQAELWTADRRLVNALGDQRPGWVRWIE
jgi:predicted nucleic acid-binding protein